MQTLLLKVIGSENGNLIAVADNGAKFLVPIDDQLRSYVQSAYDGEEQRQASPREIQTLLRAGHSVEQVASQLGTAESRVRRFQQPVLAEMEHIVRQALHSGGEKGDGYGSLGEYLERSLAELNASEFTSRAWKEPEGEWFLEVLFSLRVDGAAEAESSPTDLRRHALLAAEWTYEPRNGHLLPQNQLAEDLLARMTLDRQAAAQETAQATQWAAEAAARAAALPPMVPDLHRPGHPHKNLPHRNQHHISDAGLSSAGGFAGSPLFSDSARFNTEMFEFNPNSFTAAENPEEPTYDVVENPYNLPAGRVPSDLAVSRAQESPADDPTAELLNSLRRKRQGEKDEPSSAIGSDHVSYVAESTSYLDAAPSPQNIGPPPVAETSLPAETTGDGMWPPHLRALEREQSPEGISPALPPAARPPLGHGWEQTLQQPRPPQVEGVANPDQSALTAAPSAAPGAFPGSHHSSEPEKPFWAQGDNPAAHMPPAPPTPPVENAAAEDVGDTARRKKRTSVPSWDDILFPKSDK